MTPNAEPQHTQRPSGYQSSIPSTPNIVVREVAAKMRKAANLRAHEVKFPKKGADGKGGGR